MGRVPVLTWLALLCLACSGESPAPALPWPGSSTGVDGSTARQLRVEIGLDTRPVLGRQPVLVLRWREPVSLRDELELATELPPDLAATALVHIETWASARPPEAKKPEATERAAPWQALAQLRQGPREILRAAPRVVRASEATATRIEVPATLRDESALVSSVARPLSPSPLQAWRLEAPELPAQARLLLAFGIEREAWAEGWPAVVFRVRAELDGEAPRTLFEQRVDPVNDPLQRRWIDLKLDVGALAGRSPVFVFEAEAQVEAEAVRVPTSLPVFSLPDLRAARKVVSPNVILVSLDTLRAQSVGSYGSERPTTPSMDRLMAAAGARVRQAVTPFPFTPPSHMTMLTGLDPCMHGVSDQYKVLPGNQLTLAERISRSGYRTAAFTENGYVSVGAGFARGFDVYVERRDESAAAPGWAKQTLGDAARWVEKVGDDPFFLFIHTYEVHSPYAPPAAYRELFSDDEFGPRKPAARENQRNYEREIRYTDDLVADFLGVLELAGLATNSIVVVTSDHGEAFGEHFVGGHGFDAHDEAVLVPMLWRAPGVIPPGLVVEAQVGLADLTPTLLELLGLEIPSELPGRSFAALLRGEEAGEALEERPILIDTVSEQTGLRTRNWKYIRYPNGKERFYHLRQNPRERGKPSAADAVALAEARAALEHQQAACKEWLRKHPPEAVEAARGARAPGWRVNRDEIDAQLRALGYAE